METRCQAKLRDTTSPPRAATVGGTQPVTDIFVEPPSSAAGHTGDGKISSRSSSLEAGSRRTCRPIPRSESAGGARGPAQGDARGENRKVADAADRERVLTPTPDEGANFTLVPFAEWRNSESCESSDASPCGLPTSGVDVNIRSATQVSPKPSTPDPFNMARTGITHTEDRQSHLGVGCPKVRPALRPWVGHSRSQTSL